MRCSLQKNLLWLKQCTSSPFHFFKMASLLPSDFQGLYLHCCFYHLATCITLKLTHWRHGWFQQLSKLNLTHCHSAGAGHMICVWTGKHTESVSFPWYDKLCDQPTCKKRLPRDLKSPSTLSLCSVRLEICSVIFRGWMIYLSICSVEYFEDGESISVSQLSVLSCILRMDSLSQYLFCGIFWRWSVKVSVPLYILRMDSLALYSLVYFEDGV